LSRVFGSGAENLAFPKYDTSKSHYTLKQQCLGSSKVITDVVNQKVRCDFLLATYGIFTSISNRIRDMAIDRSEVAIGVFFHTALQQSLEKSLRIFFGLFFYTHTQDSVKLILGKQCRFRNIIHE